MHNGWAVLVVLCPADPHLLEAAQGCQNGSSCVYERFTEGDVKSFFDLA